MARPLSVLAPHLLRDIIHRARVGRVRENLAASGVEADVRATPAMRSSEVAVTGRTNRLLTPPSIINRRGYGQGG